ncbi:unnamed protein product [Durusdinium trenchii]|uniref:Peroxin-13 n=2 Tax=Durusdinium trenchii TaxID=1381693 RepID=A0ABP0SX64_9DINO
MADVTTAAEPAVQAPAQAPAQAAPAAAPAQGTAAAPVGQSQIAPGYPSQYGQPPGYGGYGGCGYGGYQPGMPGQPMPGMPGQPGQMQPIPPQDMRPQLNFRTVVRCFMEIAAIIQGFSLILMMGNGWLQEMGSNEEQPMRRFAVWLGSSVRGAVSSLIPLAAFRKRHRSLEEIWDTQPAPPRPTRWWVVLGMAYFAASFLQEWNSYRRIRQTVQRTPPSGEGSRGSASASNLLDFYMQKQQELHRQKTRQGASDPPGSEAVKAPTGPV